MGHHRNVIVEMHQFEVDQVCNTIGRCCTLQHELLVACNFLDCSFVEHGKVEQGDCPKGQFQENKGSSLHHALQQTSTNRKSFEPRGLDQ